ncbi:MAG: ABC transporter permease [Candidatus Hodarchaeales archaeon]|jgi:ABC-type Na+ efflux pump permease subunit
MKRFQLFYLIKQEIRRSLRTRGILIAFFILPLITWGYFSGLTTFTSFLESDDSRNIDTLYITSNDSYGPINLPIFKLLFDYNNKPAGSNISHLELDDYLIQRLTWIVEHDNTSTLYLVYIKNDLSYSEVEEMANKGKIDYWIHINENFTSNFINYGYVNNGEIELRYLPSSGDLVGPVYLKTGLDLVLSEKPFTDFSIEKLVYVNSKTILLGDEEETTDERNFLSGLVGMIMILFSTMIPAPYISHSFAGEREKKTMESLLALPITRRSILIGKVLAGLCLSIISTILAVIGMVFVIEMNLLPEVFLLEFNVVVILTVVVVTYLSIATTISLGISIGCLSKDVKSAQTMNIIPLMVLAQVLFPISLIFGTPEEIGLIGLVLYFLPWTHLLVMFQKIMRPSFFEVKSLLGYGLVADLMFHLISVLVIIAIAVYLGIKIFEREGIVG